MGKTFAVAGHYARFGAVQESHRAPLTLPTEERLSTEDPAQIRQRSCRHCALARQFERLGSCRASLLDLLCSIDPN